MTKEDIVFAKQTFRFDKGDLQWRLELKRSDINSSSMAELSLLELKHPFLLEQTMEWDEEKVIFYYQIEKYGQSFQELSKQTMSNKLRLALNLTDLESCLALPITFFLAPVNLFITRNGVAKLAYRALPEVMTPSSLSEADFLRQLKCLILALFTDNDFEDLYKGALEVVTVSDFLKEIVAAESVADIREQLQQSYEEKKAEEERHLIQVSRRKFGIFKHLAIWMSALAVLLIFPLAYMFFFQTPFQQKLLDADRDFLKLDYSTVISTLKSVEVDRLPYTQKYELAYSYIQGLDFSQEQREAVLNNISLKTDELLLDYWIEVGRGHADEAMDISKRLEDYDLIIYAIVLKIEQVKDDPDLSGKEREEELDSLQTDYETYQEERQKALDGGESGTGTSQSSSASTKQ